MCVKLLRHMVRSREDLLADFLIAAMRWKQFSCGCAGWGMPGSSLVMPSVPEVFGALVWAEVLGE